MIHTFYGFYRKELRKAERIDPGEQSIPSIVGDLFLSWRYVPRVTRIEVYADSHEVGSWLYGIYYWNSTLGVANRDSRLTPTFLPEPQRIHPPASARFETRRQGSGERETGVR